MRSGYATIEEEVTDAWRLVELWRHRYEQRTERCSRAEVDLARVTKERDEWKAEAAGAHGRLGKIDKLLEAVEELHGQMHHGRAVRNAKIEQWKELQAQRDQARAELAASKQECDGWVEKYASLVAAAARDANALRAANGRLTEALRRMMNEPTRYTPDPETDVDDCDRWICQHCGQSTAHPSETVHEITHADDCDYVFALSALSATSQPSGGASATSADVGTGDDHAEK